MWYIWKYSYDNQYINIFWLQLAMPCDSTQSFVLILPCTFSASGYKLIRHPSHISLCNLLSPFWGDSNGCDSFSRFDECSEMSIKDTTCEMYPRGHGTTGPWDHGPVRHWKQWHCRITHWSCQSHHYTHATLLSELHSGLLIFISIRTLTLVLILDRWVWHWAVVIER